MQNIDYTQMSIGERLKHVRVEILKISLETFSVRLGMKSRSSMSRYERSGFKFSDRIIKQLCTEFLINEDWLRTGEGEIFQSYVDDLKDICKKYNIDDTSEKLIRHFISLEQNERESVTNFLVTLGRALDSDTAPLTVAPVSAIELPKITPVKSNESNYDVEEDVEIIELPLYSTKASAGIGKYLGDNDPFEMIKFPLTQITRKADFAVQIAGDSMERLIENGQTIFVKSMPRVEHNQIGLFLYNEEVFCKRLVLDKRNSSVILRSENENYKDIIIDDLTELRTLGLVLL